MGDGIGKQFLRDQSEADRIVVRNAEFKRPTCHGFQQFGQFGSARADGKIRKMGRHCFTEGFAMIKSHWAAVCVLLFSLFSLSAYGADSAGMIKVAKGLVSIERDGKKMMGEVGIAIEVSDRIRTGSDGSVGITLRDNTLLSAGPNSLIVIDKFAFNDTTQDGNISIGVRKGTLSVASGRIAKRTPESVDFHTPTSVLGVRGTEFVIEVAGSSDE